LLACDSNFEWEVKLPSFIYVSFVNAAIQMDEMEQKKGRDGRNEVSFV
jgi:hypothetical protein